MYQTGCLLLFKLYCILNDDNKKPFLTLLVQYSTLKYNLNVGMSLASRHGVGCCPQVQKEPRWAGGITYHLRETKFQITD